jgi:hypothetical protein
MESAAKAMIATGIANNNQTQDWPFPKAIIPIGPMMTSENKETRIGPVSTIQWMVVLSRERSSACKVAVVYEPSDFRSNVGRIEEGCRKSLAAKAGSATPPYRGGEEVEVFAGSW